MTKMTKMIIGVVIAVVVVGGVVGYFLFKTGFSGATAITVGTNSNRWSPLSIPFKTDPRAQWIKVTISGNNIPTAQGIIFDGIKLTQAGSSVNIIPNGSFEESANDDYWSFDAKYWERDPEFNRYCYGHSPFDGSCGLGFVSDGNSKSASIWVKVNPNTNYVLYAFFFKTSPEGTAKLKFAQYANQDENSMVVDENGNRREQQECSSKWDCNNGAQACWSGKCTTAKMVMNHYQILEMGAWQPYLPHDILSYLFGPVPVPGKPVATFIIAFRAKRADVDVSKVNLPNDSVDFASRLIRFFQGASMKDAFGLDPNDYEMMDRVRIRGGKHNNDSTYTGDSLAPLIGIGRKKGVGFMLAQVNNPQQAFFHGTYDVYAEGTDKNGAYYETSSNTRWWNNYLHFFVVVVPRYPID